MPLSIRIPGASFSSTIASLSLPDRAGLVGEYVFGGSRSSSIRNRAGGGSPDLDEVNNSGAGVSYASNHAVFAAGGGQNYGFDVGIPCPENATLIAVVMKLSGFPLFLASGGFNGFGNYGGKPNLYNNNSGVERAYLPGPISGKFVFYAGQLPFGQVSTIWGAEDGSLVSADDSGAGSSNSPRSGTPLTIGGALTVSNTGSGVARIAYAAIFQRVLSDQEIADAYGSLTAYLTTRGVDME